ncbi:hypothetical protein BH10PSE13_BH10PSE13_06590 [soil metagenome]
MRLCPPATLADVQDTWEKWAMRTNFPILTMFSLALIGGCASRPPRVGMDVATLPNFPRSSVHQAAFDGVDRKGRHSAYGALRATHEAKVTFECHPGQHALEREQLRVRLSKALGEDFAATICVHLIQLPQRAAYKKLAVTHQGLDDKNKYLGFYAFRPDGIWYDVAPNAYSVPFDPSVDRLQFAEDGNDGLPNIVIRGKFPDLLFFYEHQLGRYVRIPEHHDRVPY